MQRRRLHGAARRDTAGDLRKIRLFRIRRYDERGRAWSIEQLPEPRRRLRIGPELQPRNVVRREDIIPARETEAGPDVTPDVRAAEIIALRHSDRRITLVADDEHFQAQGVDGHRCELLQVL